jgi:hypothetical protein
MNSIMMVVGAVIAVLIVFIIFSQDELEDEDVEEIPAENQDPVGNGNSSSGTVADSAVESAAAGATVAVAVPSHAENRAAGGPSSAATNERSAPGRAPGNSNPVGPAIGSEEDFKFRFVLTEQIPPVTSIKTVPAVACVVQLRFPEMAQAEAGMMAGLINLSEKVLLADDLPFPFEIHVGNQTDRLLLFGFEEERDDAVLEAMVTAGEITRRFRKLLEGSKELLQVKARLAVGISQGPVSRILRGPAGTIAHAGRAVYLAETFAESAGDFQTYVDEDTFRQAMPLFDFREWKPTRLRQSMPPIAFYELVGWNKKEEIFAFASHAEAYARRAVAVAYRYLDFDDLTPLLGLVSDPDERVALDALATVTEIGDERALGILKKLLPEARNAVLRSAVIEALGKVGKDEVVPALLASTKDVSWLVRFKAAKSLYQIAKGEALRHIEHLTGDDDGAVRSVIHQILYREFRREKDLLALRDLLTDLSLRARKAAVEALMEISGKEALSMVAQSFVEQEPEIKRHILRLFVKAKANSLYQCFLTMFHAADPRDHADIIAAVRRAHLLN